MSEASHRNHELSVTDQPSPPSPNPENPFLCTICRDTCEVSLQTQIPTCHHTFCLSCVLSWTKVRETCPNCKNPFSTLLVHRDLTGSIVTGPYTASGTPPWVSESVALLRRVEWVQTREVLSPVQDIESSFTIPSQFSSPSVSQSSSSPAPHYLNEEFEDELESRFWEEEELQFDRLMSSRVMSNRRFGANGYISAGRLRATPRPPARGKKHEARPGSSAAGASSAHGTQVDNKAKRSEKHRKGSQNQGAASSSGGGRKKKLKKKSREGIAQAARKKAEAEAAAVAEAEALAGRGGGGGQIDEIAGAAGSVGGV
eukprot:GFKZ01012342.1.p1 GENE.GFKZ01012342.1~~GFKZ01012342.1.p1  ORF type:complete len:314 (+),score=47.67 GFKZ01012342.1:381-1322(+)